MKNKINQLRLQREHYQRIKPDTKFYTIRFPQEDYEELQLMAELKGTSVAELIRTFIIWGLENGDGDASKVD